MPFFMTISSVNGFGYRERLRKAREHRPTKYDDKGIRHVDIVPCRVSLQVESAHIFLAENLNPIQLNQVLLFMNKHNGLRVCGEMWFS